MVDALESPRLPDTDEGLKEYVRAKQSVVDLLREGRRALAPLGRDDPRFESLLSRLAEDRFNLVVLGEFKRGKTSLVNAILGRPLLPTAAVPLTSVVTAVRYGPFARATILRSGLNSREEVPLASLADFITERGNPGNEKGIASAEVEAPASFLKRGLYLVDTPGVGSLQSESTAATRAFLPEADAAVFVTSTEAPLSRSELSFLESVRTYVRKVFFVVNKVDALGAEERRAVLEFVERALRERLRIERPRVFPLSARLALDAKASGADDTLAASGLPALEAVLADFLRHERQQVFLAAIVDRLVRLLESGRLVAGLRDRQDAAAEGSLAAALRRRLDGLEAARRAALAGARTTLAAWEEGTLAPALAEFETSSRKRLLSGMPGLHPRGFSDPGAYHEQLTRWQTRSLSERAAAWEVEHAPTIDAFARGLSNALQARLAATVSEVVPACAEVLGMASPSDAGPEGLDLDRGVPGYEPAPAAKLDDDRSPAEISPLLPWPGPLGRRVARWLVARSLPDEVRRAGVALHGRVHSHLEARIQALDVASAQALRREGDRVSSSPGSHAHVDVGALERLIGQLTRLRDSILGFGRGFPPNPRVDDAVPAERAVPRSAGGASAVKPRDWARSATCPVCAHVLDAVFDFMSQFQHALATDPATQAEFRNAGGFCPLHAWQLEELSSPRGLASGYPALLDGHSERLRRIAARPASDPARFVAEMTTRANCAACREQASAEADAANSICADLATDAGRARYEPSRGVCLRHLPLVLSRVSTEAACALLRHASRRCEDVSESLHAYALKFDGHRQELLSREEAAAYRQATVLVAGERRVFR
jgi:hypothetical protein